MSEFDIDIRLVDGKTAVDETSVDYVPFGMKVLKLEIRKRRGPARQVWIRAANFEREQDPCLIAGYADDGEDLQVLWGAGDIMGFSAKYLEQAGTKKPVALDDDEPHVVYLHLIHRPADPESHIPRDRQLTVVAITTDQDVADLVKKECRQRQHQDQIVAQQTFTLTVPQGAENPIRPLWTRDADGHSTIRLLGQDVPRYVSRWWPSRLVEYTRLEDLPQITLDYQRLSGDHEGTVDAWLETERGREHLARVEGHLTLPLYDLRWFLPELYRFYDDRQYSLRLTFFWIDEDIGASDLLSFVPEDERPALTDQAIKDAAEIMGQGLLGKWLGWAKQYEIPDIERFDIVFDPESPAVKYGCTDGHWREFWLKVDPGQACRCSIAAPKDAYRVVLDHFMRHFAFFEKEPPQPVTNPLEEGGLVEVITAGRCYYDRAAGQITCDEEPRPRPKAPGLLGKNAPTIENAQLLDNGLSSDVLLG